MSTPELKRVLRLDAMPLKAQYTAEGYLLDKPVLTSTGIFEYTNHDGSKRRELRLPEDVFDPESLKSYRGKPVVVTHDAGLITKDNVAENQIGTIISEGYQSGDDVRAEIIIHDTDEMKDSGFKQLSLGYNLDLEETPGVWKGEHYDAIQRNIRINHLALVREARAGDQARLNIDSRDGNSLLIGGKVMKKNPKKARRADGVLSPEELQKAIEEYKAKRAKTDADEEPKQEEPVMEEPVEEEAEVEVAEDAEEEEPKAPETPEEKVQFVKDRRDLRDEEGDPKDTDEAMVQIAHQDEDIQMLIDIIDTLLAERDFKETKEDDADEEIPDATEGEVEAEENEDCGGKKFDDADEEIPDMTEEEVNEDEDDEELEEEAVVVEENEDEDEEEGEELPRMNEDSVDRIVRERVKVGMVGRLLNLDGLENVKLKTAKKAIINAVHPEMRLDGKSSTYIDVAYDLAVKEAKARAKKDTNYQKKQMFNKDAAEVVKDENTSTSARDRMIERQMKRK
jgi:hypothetical protein